MAENGQAFHFLEAAEPGAQPLDGSVIDSAVACEWGNGSGDKAAQVKGFHENSSDRVGFRRDRRRTIARRSRGRTLLKDEI
jgi:hypothetical protein